VHFSHLKWVPWRSGIYQNEIMRYANGDHDFTGVSNGREGWGGPGDANSHATWKSRILGCSIRDGLEPVQLVNPLI
jgi:hypothetical protein